jgi:hypothetical protein
LISLNIRPKILNMNLHKYLIFAWFSILLLATFSACEPEVVEDIGPSVSLSSDPGFIYKDTSLVKSDTFKLRVLATPGSNDLKLLQVNENDSKIVLDRLISGIDENPQQVIDADVDGFTWDIEIQAQAEGTAKYTVFVEDESGLTNGVIFYVNDVYTPLDGEAGGLKVYNFARQNNVSLDLHKPKVVSSNDPGGDLQDLGIDPDLPETSNWIQKIRPKNGAKLFLPAEDIDFDAINSKEALLAAFDGSTQLLVSEVLETGNVYLASTPSEEGITTDYFVLRVDNIVITPDNNEDFYEFSLKQALFL